jgi:hydrogenase expression/formation protein HypE
MSPEKERGSRRMSRLEDDRILLAHGGGGIMMKELVSFLVGAVGGQEGALQDSAVFESPEGRIAFTTDSFVVHPLFFPGGDIGHLAVCGTVNDLAVCGAVPKFISLAMIIEEGFPVEDLGRITASIRAAAEEAGVTVVTGDTKVVDRGKADGIFINTAGIGIVPEGVDLSSDAAREGDRVIVSGTIGDHGLAILSMREGIDFGSDLKSDAAPLSLLTVPLLEKFPGIRAMRDATRGGLAAVLNEIASDSGVCVRIDEQLIPVGASVRNGCELMGYDPLNIANEGKLVAVVGPDEAEAVLEAMRGHELGRDAAVIGEIGAAPAGQVVMKTAFGGERVVDLPYGDLLPRIC